MRVLVAVTVILLVPAVVLVGLSARASDGGGGGGAVVGGTLRISQPADFRSTDPALAQRPMWELEHATCAKLFNYDVRGRLVPEIAAPRAVRGRAHRLLSLRIARGWRFSDGRPVTAEDVAATIERVRDPRMVSPGATYLREVQSVRAVPGGQVRIALRRPVPDLEHRLALPYFCIVPRETEIDSRGVDEPVTAGPYYIAARSYRRHLVLRRNPHYRGPRGRGPGEIVYTFGAYPSQVTLQIERGQADYGPIPADEYGSLARRYGVNSGRIHVAPQSALAYLALNSERPLFRNNPQLRRAVNYAIDRRVLVRQLGGLGGEPTDQYLPPAVPGFRDARLYPLRAPDLPKARRLARGNLRGGTASYWTCSDAACRFRAEAVQDALARIGLEVRIRVLYGAGVAARRVAIRGERFDITDALWQPEYPDPYGFLQRLVSGREIRRTENVNLSYFGDAELDRRLDRLSRLEGAARYRAFGDLDVELARDDAPLVAYATPNARAFVADRVGCVRFHPVYGVDLAALCFRD